ncbi:putative quinol monooxygenase [Sediminibacterium salmoneum]|uniref:putative quinol monooxygenase n=1 Tax=Sediminibacterium salmoneum TaxID=426421 RepID=UPI0004B09FF0|nr:hypothetical protein [Sediminibacterium salmoneum]
MTKYILSLLFITGIIILLSVDSKAQTTKPIYRIAKIKVDGNKLEQYKSALQEQMNAAIKQEPGVLSYTAVSDKKETVKDMVLSLELIDTDLIARARKKEF